MKHLTDQEKKWREILGTSTNPQEIIEMAAKLKMAPVTMEEAMEIVEMHKPGEQEKGFMELLLEASATEDLTEKEAIYAKIEELEIKKEREESRHSAS